MAPPPRANVKAITILLPHLDSILSSYWWIESQVVNPAKLTPQQQPRTSCGVSEQLRGYSLSTVM